MPRDLDLDRDLDREDEYDRRGGALRRGGERLRLGEERDRLRSLLLLGLRERDDSDSGEDRARPFFGDSVALPFFSGVLIIDGDLVLLGLLLLL